MGDNISCKTCKYRGSDGLCRLRAAVYHPECGSGIWPYTYDADWCGEWESRGAVG
jgi:hypothetical protein